MRSAIVGVYEEALSKVRYRIADASNSVVALTLNGVGSWSSSRTRARNAAEAASSSLIRPPPRSINSARISGVP